MRDEQAIWHNHQRVYDRWFPAIMAGFIVIFGALGFLIVLDFQKVKQQSIVNKAIDNSSIIDSQIQQLESGVIKGAESKSASSSRLVNLKTASESDLDRLSGIGPKRARQIVALRSEGKINSVSDLQLVKGIGEKLYDEIKGQLVWE